MPNPALDRAMALHQAGELAQAEPLYRSILATDPNNATAAGFLGVLLHQLKRNDEALEQLRHAIRLVPGSPSLLSNLGMVLADARQLSEAERVLREAVRLQPSFAPAVLNLGKVLLTRDQYDAAYEVYLSLTAQCPAEAYCGLGDALQGKHYADLAGVAYRTAIQTQNNPAARLGLASTLLLSGALDEGWPLYEVRWEIAGRSPSGGFSRPRWDGSNLAGKTILLHAEQGLGDTIQFIRYVPLVKARGGQTILLAPDLLAQLLAGQPSIDRIVTDRNQVGPFDVQCPLLSLPGVFRTTLETIPSATRYLQPNPEKVTSWQARFALPRPVVGVVWAGSATHENDLKRSIPFDQFRSLFASPGVHWISLQKERREQDGALIDWTSELHDLSDTAALIANLDVVITVDTAVAHLAGALGKPTWLLLPYAPDWRWMWNREDSPWYPTMRLFRQTTPGDWSGPIQRVAAELQQLRHI